MGGKILCAPSGTQGDALGYYITPFQGFKKRRCEISRPTLLRNYRQYMSPYSALKALSLRQGQCYSKKSTKVLCRFTWV